MIHGTFRKDLLFWVTALTVLLNLSYITAVKRHGPPSTIDVCPAICQSTVMIPCSRKCRKGPPHKLVACQMECNKKYDKCVDDCHKNILKSDTKKML